MVTSPCERRPRARSAPARWRSCRPARRSVRRTASVSRSSCGIHRRDVDVDVVGRAGNPVGAADAAAIGLRRKLPERVALPVAHRKMHVDVGLVARVPERQPRQQPVAVAVVGDVLGGRCRWCRAPGSGRRADGPGATNSSASSSDIHFCGSLSSMSSASRSSGAGLGEIDEIVGLLDRIAGAGEVIGAPFQAERLGHGPARLEQFARDRMALPQRLAEPAPRCRCRSRNRAAAGRRTPC